MLTAIKSLYVSGTLSMKVGGTAGAPGVQRMGVRQGCPLSPALFGVLFDGLHEHMGGMAPGSGLMLGSSHRVPFLCYADDDVLLSDTSQGLQQLIDSMHGFCVSLGLSISVAKTEVLVLHGAGIVGSWSLHGLALPWSSSFNYLVLVFHKSGDLDPMLRQLHSAGQGAWAKLQANHDRLSCTTSLPMLLRLFSALFAPAISYGCEVWVSQLQGRLGADARKLQGIQCAFLRNFCGRLPVVFLSLPFSVKWLRILALRAGGSSWSRNCCTSRQNRMDGPAPSTHGQWRW